MTVLPNELIVYTLAKLDIDSLQSAQLVCKLWASKLCDEYLWMKVFAAHFPSLLDATREKARSIPHGWRRLAIRRHSVGRFFDDTRPTPYAVATTSRSTCFYCRRGIALNAYRRAVVIRGVQSVPYSHMACDLVARAKHMEHESLDAFIIPGGAHLVMDDDEKLDGGEWIRNLLALRSEYPDTVFNTLTKHKAVKTLSEFNKRLAQLPPPPPVMGPDLADQESFAGKWPPKRLKMYGPRIWSPKQMNGWQRSRVYPHNFVLDTLNFEWPDNEAFDQITGYPEFLYT